MNKRWLYGGLLLALVAALSGGSYALAKGDDNGVAKARLNGYNEVVGPGSISTVGRGKFGARIDQDAQKITYKLTYTLENSATVAHLHFAQQHVGGGVIAFLCGGGGKPACPSPGGTVEGTITPDDIIGPETQGIEAKSFAEAVRAIRAGAVYANVHSTRWPAGEIRGQLHGGNHGHGHK
jgi:CHRD domain-containing protein